MIIILGDRRYVNRCRRGGEVLQRVCWSKQGDGKGEKCETRGGVRFYHGAFVRLVGGGVFLLVERIGEAGDARFDVFSNGSFLSCSGEDFGIH